MNEQLQTEICARIKQARIETGMTLEEMSDALGVTLRAYWNYENNRVPFKRLKDIAELVNVSIEWLLRGDPEGQQEGLTALIQGVSAAVATLEQSQESVHEKLDEALALLEQLAGSPSSDQGAGAPGHRGILPA